MPDRSGVPGTSPLRYANDVVAGRRPGPWHCYPARGGIAVARSNEVWGVYRCLWLGRRRWRSKDTSQAQRVEQRKAPATVEGRNEPCTVLFPS